MLPAAEAVARQRAAQIVLRVDDGQPAVALDAFEQGRREDPPGRAAQHVERLPQHVAVGDAHGQLAGQRLRQQAAHRFVEAAAGAPLGRIDQQEAAVGDVPAQARDVRLRRQREAPVARQHQERVAEEVGIGRPDLRRVGRGRHAGAADDLPGQAAQRGRARIGQPRQREAREAEQRPVADRERATRPDQLKRRGRDAARQGPPGAAQKTPARGTSGRGHVDVPRHSALFACAALSTTLAAACVSPRSQFCWWRGMAVAAPARRRRGRRARARPRRRPRREAQPARAAGAAAHRPASRRPPKQFPKLRQASLLHKYQLGIAMMPGVGYRGIFPYRAPTTR